MTMVMIIMSCHGEEDSLNNSNNIVEDEKVV